MDRHKNEFLAVLGHELRNPIMALSAGLHFLKRRKDPEAAAEIHAQMERQVAHLTRLVDDLLDISRIDQGKLALKREPVALQAILDFAVEASRPQIEAAGHALAVERLDTPTWLHGDATRLAQVVSNLLNNAAKYTPAGGHVALCVRVAEGVAEIEVSDNGIGIPEPMQAEIFELFAQVKSPTERAQEGLGIGLALVKELVELHGGTVQLKHSAPDQGSTFAVRLPVLVAPIEERAAADVEA
ncbi:HAMP domain-containing histidine kinase [Phenylobacterium sp. J426]|uniref:sensor histidine kinase n=1 Tax=Phenylobacterium sp. J426 TaxID=2898439 RepID=UPI0021512AA3|nr:HAMP domain-containing sensor histidine kinase [Phenylobacterium sp. J426]MCR5876604.1 HAMP domain-containing histidine kinase [Phenylobacterium sp. J426]